MSTEPKFKTNDRARHLKTCLVGTIKSEPNELDGSYNVLIIGSFGEEVFQTWYEKDMEPLNVEEFYLVENIIKAKRLKTELNKRIEEAKTMYGAAEEAMQAYLERMAIQGTKRYEAIGQVSVNGMDCHASIAEENKDMAFKEIEEIGRGEIIKRTIHPGTLESFVNELLDTGKPIPQHISYFLRPKLSFAKKK